jgi:hypothetical protein
LYIGITPNEIAIIVSDSGVGRGPGRIIEDSIAPDDPNVRIWDKEATDRVFRNEGDCRAASGLSEAIRKVVELFRVIRVFEGDGSAIGFHERQISPCISIEFKIGVKLSALAILVGGEDDQ